MDSATQNPTAPPPQAIHHEMRTAENSASYLLPKIHSMKGKNPNLKILDVGAGSGSISAILAQAIPEGRVTATDLNKDILPRAQAVAESAGVKNIQFEQADAYKLSFADETFDVTNCHQVLAHLKAPWDILHEMLRVTKPGGVVAAREGDFETECVWPEFPALVKFHDAVSKVINAGGGSSTAGRQLLSWALKAGAERSQITVSCGTWCYSTSAEKDIWARGLMKLAHTGRMRDAGLKAGLVTESELEDISKAWEEWAQRDDSIFGMMHGEILIQK